MRHSEIPVIDISPFLVGGAAGRAEVARQFEEVCTSVGFLIISGHGVASELLLGIHDEAERFFDLPLGEKLMYRADTSAGPAPGFRQVGETSLARSLGAPDAPADAQEVYSIYPTPESDEEYYRRPEAAPFFRRNVWPEALTSFQATCEAYFAAVRSLANTVVDICEVALALTPGYLRDLTDKPMCLLNLVNYPAAIKALPAAAHTDFGMFTILHKEEGTQGLQVLHPSGDWIDVQPLRDTFIVNIGDLLARWTNDHWNSTLHRVVKPSVSEASRNISAVVFCNPNYDAIIRPMGTCVTAENPAKYPPIVAGEHRNLKRARMLSVADQHQS